MSTSGSVAVIGAGIIGISIGLELQRRGFSVCLYDREALESDSRASAGNAGAFAFTDVMPLATPGIMRKAPKWLFDPLGPLSIPPQYALNIAPWMLRFWRASQPDRYAAGVAAQSALMAHSRTALERLVEDVDGEVMLLRQGQLQLYEGVAEFRATQPEWDLRRDHGIPFETFDSADAIAEIQPGLDPRFTHAGFTPTWINVVEPQAWRKHLAQVFLSRGGTFETAEITSLAQDGATAVLHTAEGPRKADFAVVAAGAFSHHLSRTLGEPVPLETERGYNTTLPAGAFDLRTHLTFAGHGFVVTSNQGGVRVGGAVELGGLKLPPNMRRAEILLQKAKKFMPGLNTDGGRQWMGFRPSLPDSLPLLDRSTAASRVIYAFGHGHLGLTQAAGTAELIADVLTQQTPAIDLSPYRLSRF
ncbi:MAG: NAD(P)/FAD-dependent oxidoreductase [Alphaproteobacteria bacterium]